MPRSGVRFGCAAAVLLAFAAATLRLAPARRLPAQPQDAAPGNAALVQRVSDHAQASASAGSDGFAFRHVVLNTTADAAEICVKFSAKLSPRAETRYADYVGIAPAVRAAIRAQDDKLCVDGLAYGTDYTITLKSGLPSASGARLAADQPVPVANDDKPHLSEGEFRVGYVARAITPGRFTLPEASVQDMYRPAFMARTASATTDVATP